MTAGAGPRPQRRAGAPLRSLAAIAFAALLSACASFAPLPAVGSDEFLTGRLALRIDADGSAGARSFSAAFDLRGNAVSGSLALSTPLGSTLAQARWRPGEVFLVTPQGRRDFATLDQLTREMLGESVPVAAWFDWLRGRPWQGAPGAVGDGTPQFEQLDWRVDVRRLETGGVVAVRLAPAPPVTVRIQLERP